MEKFEPAQSGRNLMDRLFSLTNNSHLFFCLLFSFQRPIAEVKLHAFEQATGIQIPESPPPAVRRYVSPRRG
jgi:hypothetical protein